MSDKTDIEDIKLIINKSISENTKIKDNILIELKELKDLTNTSISDISKTDRSIFDRLNNNLLNEDILKEMLNKQTNTIRKLLSDKKSKEDIDQEKVKHLINTVISDLDNIKIDRLGNVLTEQSPKLVLNCNKPTEIKSNKTVLTDNIDGNNLTISQEVKINRSGIDVSVNTLNNGQMIHETLKFNIESDRDNIFENRISESEIDLQCKAKF